MTGELAAAALRYAAAGWPVFPVRPASDPCPAPGDCPCKSPLTAHGFKDATCGPDVIRGWWRRWPDANVGIATGAPGPDVLDVDKHSDGDGFASFNRLKVAGLLTGGGALVRTPRGGLHVYYRGTWQPNGSLARAGHHIDFRGSGGYVLAPPSRVHGQPYELLDHRATHGCIDWQAVKRLLIPPEPARPAAPYRGETDMPALAAWVAAQPEGNRNAGLYWAACRAAEAGADLGPLLRAAITAGLGETEARATIKSAAGRARA
jgi:hypothetical protein